MIAIKVADAFNLSKDQSKFELKSKEGKLKSQSKHSLRSLGIISFIDK